MVSLKNDHNFSPISRPFEKSIFSKMLDRTLNFLKMLGTPICGTGNLSKNATEVGLALVRRFIMNQARIYKNLIVIMVQFE